MTRLSDAGGGQTGSGVGCADELPGVERAFKQVGLGPCPRPPMPGFALPARAGLVGLGAAVCKRCPVVVNQPYCMLSSR